MRFVFTRHAFERMKQRKIERDWVLAALSRPDALFKRMHRYYYQKRLPGGVIEIVAIKTKKNIRVITLYWV